MLTSNNDRFQAAAQHLLAEYRLAGRIAKKIAAAAAALQEKKAKTKNK
jgi:hypothetical protein